MAEPTPIANTTTQYNNLARDASRTPIQVGNTIQTQDNTETPKTSPLTVSNSAITLAVPLNAVRVTLYSTSNDIRVSDRITSSIMAPFVIFHFGRVV